MIDKLLNTLFGKPKYEVVFYRGDYSARQRQANADHAICYVEHHFNSSVAADPTTADYSVVIVGSNASRTSIEWGRSYSKLVDQEFDEIKRVGGVDGVLIGGYGGRGDGNISDTKMPAILVEPMFCNDPEHAEVIRSKDGQERLAKVLVYSIRKTFPKGGKVGFSVGHKYKKSNPQDRGAALFGGGTEADYAEIVLTRAKILLES